MPEIVDWDERSVDFKWEAPLRDNGAPITACILAAKPEGTPEFQKAAEVGPGTTGTTTGLTPGQKYQFPVRAVNKAGPGDASDVIFVHFFLNRFFYRLLLAGDVI